MLLLTHSSQSAAGNGKIILSNTGPTKYNLFNESTLISCEKVKPAISQIIRIRSLAVFWFSGYVAVLI